MTISLSYLLGAIILSVFQVFLAAAVKRSQDGLEWGTGNRDTDPPNYTGLAGRMVRAQANLLETLPGFIGAVLIAHVAGRENAATAWGAGLYFWGRLIYIPVYAFGLVPWRSIVWGVAMIGLALVVISLAF